MGAEFSAKGDQKKLTPYLTSQKCILNINFLTLQTFLGYSLNIYSLNLYSSLDYRNPLLPFICLVQRSWLKC